MMARRVLFVDNYDSFTYNVVHLLAAAGAVPDVMLNDDRALEPAVLPNFDLLVIGPGPGNPGQQPRMLAVLEAAMGRGMPVFGVCLGLQAIGQVLGARVSHAPAQMHGKVSSIEHDGTGVFSGLPSPLVATRYHSLCLDPQSLPAALRVTARSDDGVIQGIAHRDLPVQAVQFHPESVLSEHGERLLRNMLERSHPSEVT